MKPNFALSLSFDGIALLHRRFPGWTLVDEVSLDTDDLQAALAELRAKAIALDPSGLRAKLVIPNDQIKYITIATTDDSDENSRDQAVRAALEGATPYPVDELSYAWSVDGSDLKIAAVARETLDEAEAFAVDHAFAPVCFVAIPTNGDFSGEPFFGETAHARSLLSKGATVTRDQTPIRIIGVSKPVTDASPVSPVDAAQEAEPPTLDSAPEATPVADIAIPAAPDDTADDAADEDTVPTPDQPAVTAPEQPDDEHASPKKSKSKPKDKTPPKGTKKADSEVAGPFTSIRASRADPLGSAPKLDAPSRLRSLIANRKDDALRPGSADMDQTSAPELPSPGAEMTPDTAQIARAAASLRPDPAERLQNTAPASEPAPDPDKAPKITFFSGRKPRSARSNTRSGSVKRIPESNAKTRFEDEKQRMTVFGARHQQVGGKPRFLGLILMAVLLLFLVGVAAWASIFLDDGLARLFGGPKDINVAEMPGAPESEDNEPIRIAVPQTPQTSTSSESADTAAIELSGSVPQETVPEAPALPAAEETASLADTLASSETLTPSASLARYAATGIWQMAPEPPASPRATGDAERIFQISVDPDIRFDDPALLPGATTPQRDAPPDTPADPPAPGVTFDIDDNGLVRATPEGAMTPQGVRVFAGRPALEPPAVMQGRTPATPVVPEPAEVQRQETEEQVEEEVAEEESPPEVSEPTSPLAAIRPRPRPDSLSPEAQTTPETDAEISSETAEVAETEAESEVDTEAQSEADAETDPQSTADDDAAPLVAVNPALAAFRPRVRPDSITADAAEDADTDATTDADADAVEAALAAANANTDAEDAGEERDETLFENATEQAVTASLTPLTRPKNFAAIVERARESASAQPVAAAQVLAPSLPSTASVAKEATERNVLNLRAVNLIGVYGSPASRRALVRLSNGRYKKVKVGDRLDGGKVAAIGDSELRYVKKGQNLTLRMPKG